MAFSSDNDVLRNNKDYQDLLHTLAVLEAQKIQTIRDLEVLDELQLKLEKDPCEVYRAISRDKVSDDGMLPCHQVIATVPEIDWMQYNAHQISTNYNTRKKKCNSDQELVEYQSKKKKDRNGSYGQPWTEEEQGRLEELLKIYPSEEVEAKRWHKIANALGNRTTKQVCCRVQKYFIKLAKAGIPVPGRMPNLATYSKKSRFKRSSTRQPSLFFNSLKPKVYMTPGTQQDLEEITSSSSDDEDDDYYNGSPMTPSTQSHSTLLPTSPDARKCTGCHSNLDSIHWSCRDCLIFLCLECVKSNWSSDSHLPSHDMVECLSSLSLTHTQTPLQYIDNDYAMFKQSSSIADYNYLDPNFCPAL